MIGVTNLMDPASINNMLWFLTFMITGLAVTYAVASKSLLLVSQAYASNPELGC
jgi:ABC-type multidrug transport system permease subunit